MPNLTGFIGTPAYSALGGIDGILFKGDGVSANVAAAGGWSATQISFNASRVSSVYDSGTTVRPAAVYTNWCIKF